MTKTVHPCILKTCSGSAEMIAQGAEARVWKCQFLQRPAIIKQRFSKSYRHPSLDETITSQRLKAEVRCMVRARKLGVLAPVPYFIENKAATIYMQCVRGDAVKVALKSEAVDASAAAAIMKQIGGAIAKMHDGGLVHGDLTTSNMLLQESDQKLVIIDFGLAFNSTNPEDKAVDLHVCERALASAHSDREGMFKIVLEAYKAVSKNHYPVFNRFADVRMRGRKRTMIG